MSIQIIDSGANLKIVVDSSTRLIAKHHVQGIRILQGDTIKLSTDAGCCSSGMYIPYAEVTAPVTANIDALRDQIGDWLIQPSSSAPSPGAATEAKQDDQITETVAVKTSVDTASTDIQSAIATELSGKATEAKQDQQLTKLDSVVTSIEYANEDITAAIASALSDKATATNQLSQASLLGDIETAIDAVVPGITSALEITSSGQATSARQDQQITELQGLGTLLTAIQSLLSTANQNKVFAQALRRDEVLPDVCYEGFALPGAAPGAAVWAIRKRSSETPGQVIYTWAGGNDNLANIWDDRTSLVYS